MKQLIFTQTGVKTDDLYPFTLTRKVQDIRVGILTIREKWEKILALKSVDEEDVPDDLNSLIPCYWIRSNLLPDKNLASLVKQLKPGEALISEAGDLLVAHTTNADAGRAKQKTSKRNLLPVEDVNAIEYSWHIFERNKNAIAFDFDLLTNNRKSEPIDESNSVSSPENVFIEKGAMVRHCIINAEDGPVYIGKNVLLMEGSCLRGPISIGEGAVVKMGAKIYGATTIGPGCIIGGEVKNSVLFANSNKAHDGYLGDSVIGEWCNMGAGTSNSNLKNTAGEIDVNLPGRKIKAGIKCGVLMGDYTKTAINTSINTGTVIGVSANVFGSGLTPKYIPSFSWGFDDKIRYELDKAIEDAARWKALKGKKMTSKEKNILKNIYKNNKQF